MGASKLKKSQIWTRESLMAQVDFSRVAQAMASVSIAASSSLGKDCATHAAHCQALLRRLGLETRYVIGYAGWRVGPQDGDLLIHHPAHVHSVGENAAAYHAWLEIGNPESRLAGLLTLRHTRFQSSWQSLMRKMGYRAVSRGPLNSCLFRRQKRSLWPG